MSAQQFTSAGRGKLIRYLWLMGLCALLICLAMLTHADLSSPAHHITILLLAIGIGLWCSGTALVWYQQRAALAKQVAELQIFHRVLDRAYADEGFVPVQFSTAERKSVQRAWQQLVSQAESLGTQGKPGKQHHQQLNQLYLALSQCNQAIVQSQDKYSLFEQICRIIVNLGHANMAWIGELGMESKRITVLSAFGSGVNYLNEVEISADPAVPSGKGPCGLSLMSDHPYWVHDFQTNPITALWHAKANEFAWKSAAFLPLHVEGKVIGCLSLYADHEHAFDQDTQRLLQGMAANILTLP